MAKYLRPGTELGRFKLKRRLGKAETGLVHSAVDTFLDSPVTIKIISKQADETTLARIQRELLISQRLHVPGVVSVHDMHEARGLRFLTLDHVEGVSIERMLYKCRGKGLDILQAVNLVQQAAELVDAVHAQEVVHGNLKPSKFVVTDDDTMALLDFSLAWMKDLPQLPVVVNRPVEALHYTAPELLMGKGLGLPNDIYSLGAILYRCVTGQTPVESAGKIKSSTGFRGSKPKLPGQLNNQVPRALEQVIMTAIAANPQSRYRSAQELVDALEDTKEDASKRSRRMRRSLEGDVSHSVELDVGRDATGAQATVEFTTILFSDIVGITTFFDKFGDLEGRKRIERHNELLFPVIRSHSGTVIKTIGDAIMASFGDEDDAVDAAIGMQKALDMYNMGVKEEEEKINIRIGINSGETIAEYGDVYGDAVNVAARVSSKAKGDQILLSENTYKLITRNRDIVQYQSQTELKGKGGVFRLYQVDWLLSDDPDEVPDIPPDLSDVPDEPEGESTQVVTADMQHKEDAGVLEKAMDVVDQTIGQGDNGDAEETSLRSYIVIGVLVLFVVLALVYGLCGTDEPVGHRELQPGDISAMERPGVPNTP